jgi:hypothetical protein
MSTTPWKHIGVIWVTVILKELFLVWRSNYEGRLKSSWTYLLRKRDRHRTFTKFRLRLCGGAVTVTYLLRYPLPLQLDITVTVLLCITAAHCRQSINFANGPRTKSLSYVIKWLLKSSFRMQRRGKRIDSYVQKSNNVFKTVSSS